MYESDMTLHCKNCKAKLTEALWRDQGEYFVPCFQCGARNIVSPMRQQIIGWRYDHHPLPTQTIQKQGV